MYKLTEEGGKYLKKGLPEINLVNYIKNKGSANISEIKDNLDNPDVAIAWAKKNGWIKIKGGDISLVKEPRGESEIREGLENVHEGEKIDKKTIDLLLKRNLIEEKKKARKVKIKGKIKGLSPEIIESGEWKGREFEKYDLKERGAVIHPGKYQPYKRVIKELKEKLISLGFREMDGPLVETSFWNFDALFQPQDHPARDLQDLFYLKHPKKGRVGKNELLKRIKKTHENGWITGSRGWGERWKRDKALDLVLRSHTTSVSARTLYKHGDKPGKYFVIGRNYRYDTVDATHLIELTQCEGIVIGKDLNFKHLLGYLENICKALGFKRVKFKPGYFPYTEPSVEGFVKHSKLGWIEIAGAGIFRPEVVQPLGIHNNRVLAWGLGMDRLAMLSLGIEDIRELYSKDLRYLREKELI